MDKKTEKKIENTIGRKLGKEMKEELDKEVRREVDKEVKKELKQAEKNIEREVDKKIELEVRKKLLKVYKKTKVTATEFKKEFRNQLVIAITAAFAFLLALSWRTPIQNSLNNLMANAGLTGDSVLMGFLSALLITLVGVLVLMWISKWKTDEDKK